MPPSIVERQVPMHSMPTLVRQSQLAVPPHAAGAGWQVEVAPVLAATSLQ